MFGDMLFASNTFADFGTAAHGPVWLDLCPTVSQWSDQLVNADVWSEQTKEQSTWSDLPVNKILNKRCK